MTSSSTLRSSALSHPTRTAPLVPSSRTPTRRSGTPAGSGRPGSAGRWSRATRCGTSSSRLCASQLRLDEIRARPLRVCWAPNNETGLANAEFVSQTGQLLDRLGIAAGLRRRVEARPGNPGLRRTRARLVPRRRGGATFTPAWRIFSTWNEPRATGPGVNRRLVTTVDARAAQSPLDRFPRSVAPGESCGRSRQFEVLPRRLRRSRGSR